MCSLMNFNFIGRIFIHCICSNCRLPFALVFFLYGKMSIGLQFFGTKQRRPILN
jgi:hypothetical protein